MVHQPWFDKAPFLSIFLEDNLRLTSLFLLKELDGFVYQYDGKKSPGLNGFNFSFIKIFWNLMRKEVGYMFFEFHRFSSIPLSCAFYFVTLITKIKNTSLLGDFHPISLVGSLYKLVAKVLSNRLGMVMDNLISPN